MRFRPNPDFLDQLARTQEVREATRAGAEAVAQEAEQLADAASAPWLPRRGSGTNTTFVVADDGETIAVVNTDHAGHLVEWGSENNPPHAPLRRGVHAAGLHFDEQ